MIGKFFKLPENFKTIQDRLVGIFVKILIFLMLSTFILTCVYNTCFDVSDSWWFGFWKIYLGFVMINAAIVAIWLLFGGIYDFGRLVKLLGSVKRDSGDDGFVDKRNKDEP